MYFKKFFLKNIGGRDMAKCLQLVNQGKGYMSICNTLSIFYWFHFLIIQEEILKFNPSLDPVSTNPPLIRSVFIKFNRVLNSDYNFPQTTFLSSIKSKVVVKRKYVQYHTYFNYISITSIHACFKSFSP